MKTTEGHFACLAFKHPQGPNLSLYHLTIFQRYLHPRRARPLLSLITVCEGHAKVLKSLCKGWIIRKSICTVTLWRLNDGGTSVWINVSTVFQHSSVGKSPLHHRITSLQCSISKYQLIMEDNSCFTWWSHPAVLPNTPAVFPFGAAGIWSAEELMTALSSLCPLCS